MWKSVVTLVNFLNGLSCYAFISFQEVTLKVPGRAPNKIVKIHIREHEAWKLQQVILLL